MTNWFTPPESLASFYVCPRCDRLPHVEAVRQAQAKLPDVLERSLWVTTVRELSGRFCPTRVALVTRYWPFAVLGLLAGAYFGLVILAMVTSGSVRE